MTKQQQQKTITSIHKCSAPLLSTLLKLLWQWFQPQVFLGMTLQAWHTLYLGSFSHFSLQILSSSVRLDGKRPCTDIFSPEIGVQVWPMAGPLKDIQRLVLKPLLCSLGCVLGVVVLLEGEPSPQSEVLSALEQVFINDLSVLCSVLSLNPD